jgi:tetratricopeptide (TPR) repeat protein
LLVSSARDAQAQPAPAGHQAPAAALDLFQRGRQAADAREYDQACRYFEASLELDRASGTLLNLGDCNEQRGRLATAWQYYRLAIDALHGSEPRDARIDFATARAAAIQPRVPRVTLTLSPGAPADAAVALDGVEVAGAALGTPLPVDPGAHRVDVRAAGRAPRSYPVQAAEGNTVAIAVDAGDPLGTAAPAAPRPAPSSASSGWRTLGFVVGGVGIAGLAVGAISGLAAIDAKNTVQSNCSETTKTCSSQAGLDAASRGATFSTVSPIGFAAGAVALAAGAYLVLSNRPDASRATALAPMLSPFGAGASLTHTF